MKRDEQQGVMTIMPASILTLQPSGMLSLQATRLTHDHAATLDELDKKDAQIDRSSRWQIQDDEDPFINFIEKANTNFNAATVPGAYIIDFFPIIKHLPEWLPGSGFLQTARLWVKDTAAMVDVPYNYTKQETAAGNAVPSFVSTGIADENSLSHEDIEDLKFTASSMYGGGADTTVSAEYPFFLAMVLYPDVQKRAQAELDSVIGEGRLPGFTDQSRLPYTNALVTGVLRWNGVAPTGVPHTALEDGFIGGYFIPKGALILTNLWNMLHDPETYPDPFKFDPERFIASPDKEAQRDPRNAFFGYGRRICPGMYLAEASLFACITISLADFIIDNVVINGVPIVPVHESTSGILRFTSRCMEDYLLTVSFAHNYPKPFQCYIRPHSEKAVSLIADLP
ncbi:cytochrome P450 [Phlegmacium glaucopus]|nr:cytochrome P450 [Phlegmacium glaucopus]